MGVFLWARYPCRQKPWVGARALATRHTRRRWSSNAFGKCSYEQPTRGTVCGKMRSMCGPDAACFAIHYQSLLHHFHLPHCKTAAALRGRVASVAWVQGYIAHKKPRPPSGPPWEPRHGPTVGSYGVAFFSKRGTPVAWVGIHAPNPHNRCRANMAHMRQSRPDSGLGLIHFWSRGRSRGSVARVAGVGAYMSRIHTTAVVRIWHT